MVSVKFVSGVMRRRRNELFFLDSWKRRMTSDWMPFIQREENFEYEKKG